MQSYILDGLLKKHGTSSTKVIELSLPTLELIRSLDARSQTERCIPYDRSISRIVQRLHEHDTKIMPVIDRYRQYHGVATINGEGTFDEVFERLSFEVENGLKSSR
jgi:adenylate kinase